MMTYLYRLMLLLVSFLLAGPALRGNSTACPPARADYSISGVLLRPDGTPLVGAPVALSGHVTANQLTDANGQFSFTNLPEGFDYVVTPGQPSFTDPIDGVSNFDLVLIRRAILGIESLQNPCQTLAADVNGTAIPPISAPLNGVSTFDLVLISRNLLGIDPGFAPEWEYIPADSNSYTALDHPMMMEVNDLSADVWLSILAVKAGDPSGCATAPLPADFAPGMQADINAVVNPGAALGVPVRVQQFVDIIGFDFSVRWDPAVLQFQSVGNFSLPGMNLSSFGADNAASGELRVSWIASDMIGLTLPNGAAIFTLNFMAVGAPGSSTPVDISPDPLPFEAVHSNLSVSGIGDTDGSVTIAGAMAASISGVIRRESGVPVPGVQVMLGGAASDMRVTDAMGQYSFDELTVGESYTVTPVWPTPNCFDPCYSVYDQYLVSQHIMGISPLPSPYALFAADVNNSQSITSLDVAQQRALMLGNTTAFTNNTCWRFIPAEYMFPVPSNPWFENVPQTRSIGNLTGNVQADFIGVQTGDVSDCAEALTANDLILTADFSGEACFDQSITVPIRVQNFNGIAALQFTLRWDPSVLAYQGVLNFGLPGLTAANFGQMTSNTNNGIVTMTWVEPNASGISVPDGALVANAFFTVIGEAGSSSALFFGDAPLPPMAVDGMSMPVTINTQSGRVEVGGPGAIVGPAYCHNGVQFISFYSESSVSAADGMSLIQSVGNNGYWLYGMSEGEDWFFETADPGNPNCRRFYFGTAGLCSEALIPDCDRPLQLTDNSTDDDQMSIWGSHLVWQGYDGSDYEIFYMDLSDPTATPQAITNNNTNDFRPSIWGNRIVWEHHNGSSQEILTLSLNDIGAAPQNLSNPASGSNPKIWGNFAVWNQGNALYYHDFSKGETQLLATTGISNSRFNLWQNRIVWEGQGGSSREIFATDLADPNAGIQQLSNNAFEDSQPQIHGNFVVWVGFPTPDGHIYAFELGVSTAPELISTTSSNNNAPAVNGNFAVWVGSDGADAEIYRYNLAQLGAGMPVVMTDNSVGDFSPAIWGNHLVWNSDGKTWYLPADQPGAAPRNLSGDPSAHAEPPQIHGHLVLWRGSDGNPELYLYDLTLLPPAAPVLDAMASVTAACSGNPAILVLQSIGAGYMAVWFDDEQMTNQLYADAANNFQPVIGSPTTYYAAWQHPVTGCIGALTPVDVQLSATDNLACNDQVAVSLNAQCEVEIMTDQLLEGMPGCLGASDFVIAVMDGDPGNGPIVDGPGNYVYTVTLAAGSTGNFTSCFGFVTAEDLIPLSIQCPDDQSITAGAGQSEAPAFWPDPVVTDNCPFGLTGTHSSGDLFPIGATEVTYTATDAGGTTAACTFFVTVAAGANLICPDDITVSNDPGSCDAFVSIPIPAAPGPGTLISSQGGADASGVYPVGATVVTYLYFEGNDTLTCSFTVTVLDTEPPVLECASDTTLFIGDGNCDNINYTVPLPVISENCPLVSLTGTRDDGRPLGDAFFPGTTCVLWIAEDEAGNQGSCTMCITVELQGNPPQITCPPDVMIFTDPGLCENNSFVMSEPVVVNDPCAPFLGVSFQPGAYGPYPKGEHTFTFYANNIFGTDSCQVTVTVEDVEPPVLLCPPDVTVNADPADGGAVVVFDDFQASDNCLMTVFDCSHQTGDFFPCGETVVACILTDMAGNTAECSFTVTVVCDESCRDSLTLTPTPADTSNNNCCWTLDYANAGTQEVWAVQLIALDGVTMHYSLPAGYTSLGSDTDVTILTTTFSPFPASVDGLMDLCLGHISAVPQTLVVHYKDNMDEIICTDTLRFFCPPEEPCLYILADSLVCDTAGYKYTAVVKNPIGSSFDVGFVKFSIFPDLPAGVNYNPGTGFILNPKLAPGDTATIMFVIETALDLSGDSLCFVLSAHDDERERLCCAEIDVCIPFPECDPCPYVEAEILPDVMAGDTCCYELLLTNTHPIAGYFDQVQTTVLTEGAYFSSVTFGFGSGWWYQNLSAVTTQADDLLWNHVSGVVPQMSGFNLFDFCLAGVTTTDSVYIEVLWMRSDSVLCRDTIAVWCPACVVVSQDTIVCNPDGSYTYTFSGENWSDYSINAIGFVPVGSNFTVSPQVVPLPGLIQPYPAPDNSFGPLSVTIDPTGAQPGDTICIDLVLRQVLNDSINILCCYVTHCIVLPECGPTSELVIEAGTPGPYCIVENQACAGPVNFPFRVENACPPLILRAIIDLDNDATNNVAVQLDADGTLTTLLGPPGYLTITGVGPDYTVAAGAVPLGTHGLQIQVEDGCGSTAVFNSVFEMEDCTAPIPTCINGLTAIITGFVDTDGDGIPDEPGVVLSPADFLFAPVTDCSPPVTFSLNRPGETPSPTQTSLVLTCSDEGVSVLQLHAWDAAGNSDYCETWILVQDNLGLCPVPPPGDGGIRIFPNPADREIWVEIPPGNWRELGLLDAEGAALQTLQPGAQRMMRVNTERLPAGLYLLRLRGEDGELRVARFVRR
ncbi:MAG: HYR domain-containing protein [Saprospiraceae bacterium]|nr:HYR domain-containing protein [Saprospiraceae bacterium]